jgi:hypothetical protein
MTISVGKVRRTGRRPRYARLAAGKRPFLAVTEETFEVPAEPGVTYSKGWHGWLHPHPGVDDADPLLRESGLQAEQRRSPCFLFVPADQLEE